jgi:hypothetical protein
MAVVVDVGNLMDGRLPLAGRARASGAWLVLHGTRLSGSSKGQTAVMIEPARSAEVAPLIVQAHSSRPGSARSHSWFCKGP